MFFVHMCRAMLCCVLLVPATANIYSTELLVHSYVSLYHGRIGWWHGSILRVESGAEGSSENFLRRKKLFYDASFTPFFGT